MSQHQHPKESTSWYPKSVIAGDISSLKPSTLGTTTPATAAVSSSSSLEVPSEERMFYASLFSHGLAALTAKLVSAPADRARILVIGREMLIDVVLCLLVANIDGIYTEIIPVYT